MRVLAEQKPYARLSTQLTKQWPSNPLMGFYAAFGEAGSHQRCNIGHDGTQTESNTSHDRPYARTQNNVALTDVATSTSRVVEDTLD